MRSRIAVGLWVEGSRRIGRDIEEAGGEEENPVEPAICLHFNLFVT